MNSAIISAAPVAISFISSLFLTVTQPVESKQYLILNNSILLNQTSEQVDNAAIYSQKPKSKDISIVTSKEVNNSETKITLNSTVQKPEVTTTTSKDVIRALIIQTATDYHLDDDQILSIAICESGLNPNAQNGIYAGLFQFSPTTWISNRNAMGANPDPALRFDPVEATKTASFKISRDGTDAWAGCI